MPASRLRIAPYQPGNEHDIVELFSVAFPGRTLPLDWWYWRFQDNPNGHGAIALAWDGDRLAGQYSIAKIKLHMHGNAILTGMAGTTMTHPDYRGQGVFTQLNEEIHAQMQEQNMPLIWSFPNDNSHRPYIEKVGRVDIYEIPVFRLQITGSNLHGPKTSDNIILSNTFDSRFDDLWREEHPKYNIISYRDVQTLQWRYLKHPITKYQVITYQASNTRLNGYAVFKRYQDELQIVDILAKSPEVGVELVSYIIQSAAQDELKSVCLWLNVNHPLHRRLEKVGFRNEGHITYFTGQILLPILDDKYIYAYRNWYLTMGDSDVF